MFRRHCTSKVETKSKINLKNNFYWNFKCIKIRFEMQAIPFIKIKNKVHPILYSQTSFAYTYDKV